LFVFSFLPSSQTTPPFERERIKNSIDNKKIVFAPFRVENKNEHLPFLLFIYINNKLEREKEQQYRATDCVNRTQQVSIKRVKRIQLYVVMNKYKKKEKKKGKKKVI